MNFASDNAYGALPDILARLVEANNGAAASYGLDDITTRLSRRFAEIFEHEVFVYPVVTGTAANALALATLVPPYGAVLCHGESHIACDECGAPEFFSHGARLVTLEGADAKLEPQSVERALSRFEKGSVHQQQPTAISITQATERGTIYSQNDIAALSAVAHRRGLKLHMDGARFANALVTLGVSPADASWRAGVDVLSFGATKNGALAAEAVLFFNRADVADIEFRRKRAGHLLSKMRFVSAQLDAYLEGDRWLTAARSANALAQKMATGLASVDGAILAHPVDANAVFLHLPDQTIARLRAAGAAFHDWAPSENGKTLIRLVLSFATPPEAVDRFLALARG
ncbi:MAG TPA: beta-eliminating lyase-related protein [Rhizomicrobium sp.]|nr:beta-eliminating lyase-related protein [Rhizomicrobium sp.]